MTELAIVVPAFKVSFLEEALLSIREQSNQDFNLYIFDDASPHDIESVCSRLLCDRPFQFHRFESNLGGRDLAAHWNRCVAKTREPWVWVFSDDDLMDPGCVEAFLLSLSSGGPLFDVYRFDTRIIADDGSVKYNSPKLPEIESAFEFALARLAGRRASFVPDHIFSRAAYERNGGFVSFPVAWCSDDATWVKLSQYTGICTIQNCTVSWRLGDSNISGCQGKHAAYKLTASLAYLAWLRSELERSENKSQTSEWLSDFDKLALRWLIGQIRSQGIVIGLDKLWIFNRQVRRNVGCGSGKAMVTTLQAAFSPIRGKALRILRKSKNILSLEG